MSITRKVKKDYLSILNHMAENPDPINTIVTFDAGSNDRCLKRFPKS